MKLSTLCYIEHENRYLMLHRTKKEQDCNAGKWIGVGGKLENGESPEECLKREVLEETGLVLKRFCLRGIITFVSDIWETEYMFLYTADQFEGELTDCTEGELAWISKGHLFELNLWEGDKIFLKYLLEEKGLFELKLRYQGDCFVDSSAISYR